MDIQIGIRVGTSSIFQSGAMGYHRFDNDFHYGETPAAGLEKSQRVIPDGDTLDGMNDRLSRIKAPSGYTGTGANSFVTTELYGTDSNNGTRVRDLYIDATAAGACNVVDIDSLNGRVENCTIFGNSSVDVGVRINRSNVAIAGFIPGSQIRGNELIALNVGIEVATPDTRISDNMVTGCDEYCLEVPAGMTSVMSSFNHYYGAQLAAVYVNAGKFVSTGDEFNDSEIGLHITGNGFNASITNPFCLHDWQQSMLLEAQCRIIGGLIEVPRSDNAHPGIVGIELNADFISIIGTEINSNFFTFPGAVSPVPCAAAIKINANINYATIDGVRLDGSSHSGEIGLLVAGATEGTDIDITAQGYDESNDRVVKFATNTFKGVTARIRGPLLGYDANEQVPFEVPAGWSADNDLQYWDSVANAWVPLNSPDAYP